MEGADQGEVPKATFYWDWMYTVRYCEKKLTEITTIPIVTRTNVLKLY